SSLNGSSIGTRPRATSTTRWRRAGAPSRVLEATSAAIPARAPAAIAVLPHAASRAERHVAGRHERRCAVTTITGNASSGAALETGAATTGSDWACSGRLENPAHSVAVMMSAATRLTRRLAFMMALLWRKLGGDDSSAMVSL